MICIDYKALKNVTIRKNNYLLPRIDNSFDWFAGEKYINHIGLKLVYNQIWSVDEHVENMVYCTRCGYYELMVMFICVVQCTLDIQNHFEHHLFKGDGWFCINLYWQHLGVLQNNAGAYTTTWEGVWKAKGQQHVCQWEEQWFFSIR